MRDVKWYGISLLVLAAVSVGCSTPAPEPADASAMGRWLQRSQGLVPVHPPREDVLVGDVHVYLRDPDGHEATTLYATPRWSQLPAAHLLAETYAARPEHPATPPDYLRTDVPPSQRTWPEATDSSADEATTRKGLRSIQLPTFAVYAGPNEEFPQSWGLRLAVHGDQPDWRAAHIGIEAAEVASLALEDAVDEFLELDDGVFYLPAMLRQNLRALAPDDLETMWVRIVTNVVYMRALRVTILSDDELDLTDDDVSPAELGEEGSAVTEASDEDLDPGYASIARATAMNRELIESGSDVLPDGFVRFLSVSENATMVRRVYRRAMAIGVGGLSLKVDPLTGEVLAMRLMGRGLPEPDPTNPDEPQADEEETEVEVDGESTTPVAENEPGDD